VVVAEGHETNVEVARFYFFSDELVSSSQLNRSPDIVLSFCYADI
jgi:hypothetical protein